MSKIRKINISDKNIRKAIKESISHVLYEVSEQPLRIEDYFDLNALTQKDILSIATDIRAFMQGQNYDSCITDDGDVIINEEAGMTMPIGQLRCELKSLGFKQWQITSKVVRNRVRIVILYADIAKNSDIIINKMASFGWIKARMSDPVIVHNIPVRAISFDPEVQKSLKDEARRYNYLYHMTPYRNLQSILTNGIEPRSENDYLSYLPKAHLLKGDIPKREVSMLGWKLYRLNKSLTNGEYAIVRVTTSKIPDNVEFYGDPHFSYGYFAKECIPPSSLDVFGKVEYMDKFNYNNEKIVVLASNDTMVN